MRICNWCKASYAVSIPLPLCFHPMGTLSMVYLFSLLSLQAALRWGEMEGEQKVVCVLTAGELQR